MGGVTLDGQQGSRTTPFPRLYPSVSTDRSRMGWFDDFEIRQKELVFLYTTSMWSYTYSSLKCALYACFLVRLGEKTLKNQS